MAAPFPSRRSLAIEAKSIREGQKARIFHADLIALVAAPGLHWEFGAASRDNTLRPVLLAYAATDQQARAFDCRRKPSMARPESQALAGYFPTPPEILPAIASLVELCPLEGHRAGHIPSGAAELDRGDGCREW